MLVVPTKPFPNQQIQVLLANQPCTLHIYQTAYGLFMDVFKGDTLIVAGVICLNANKIIRSAYLGFIGDFVFVDSESSGESPVYTGLGTRFTLLYLEEADISAAA